MAINNALNAPIPFVVSKGGTGATSLTDGGVLLGSGTGAITALNQASDGQLVIGSTGGDPVLATLTAGVGVSITNGSGSITINAADNLVWNNNGSSPVTMMANNGYINNTITTWTATIPATAAVGDIFRIVSSGDFVLQANTGQVVNFGDDATSTAGSITSTEQASAIAIVCTVANTTFSVISAVGNMTVA